MRDTLPAAVKYRNWVLLLQCAVIFVLLIASVNLANLLLARHSERRQELTIRLALGARTVDVLGLVIRQAMVLALCGVACGLAGAFALMRAMRSLLFGVGSADPLTYSISAVVLAGVALVACALPARRAARVDPVVALRCE